MITQMRQTGLAQNAGLHRKPKRETPKMPLARRAGLKMLSADLVKNAICEIATVRDMLVFNKRLQQNALEIGLRLHSLLGKLEGGSK